MTWFVGLVRQFAHHQVERDLASLGCQAFYPRLRRWISHARTRIAAERPLLGNYLFVETDQVTGLELVRSVHGLQALLANADGQPAPIPDEIVFEFRARYMRGEFDVTMRNIPLGALIRITEGEFAEQLAIVTGVQRGKIIFTARGSRHNSTTRRSNISAA